MGDGGRRGWDEGWESAAGSRTQDAGRRTGRTLAKLAVKSTHSKSCPILWRNSSTCGRFRTYTCSGRRQELSVIAARDSLGLGRAAKGALLLCTARPMHDLLRLAHQLPHLNVDNPHREKGKLTMSSRVLRIFGASKWSTAVPCPGEVTHVLYP